MQKNKKSQKRILETKKQQAKKIKINGFKTKIIYALLLVSLIVGGYGFVRAYTGPPGSPPSCPTGYPGCDAPINVSSQLQNKTGNLTLGGKEICLVDGKTLTGAACSGSGGGSAAVASGLYGYCQEIRDEWNDMCTNSVARSPASCSQPPMWPTSYCVCSAGYTLVELSGVTDTGGIGTHILKYSCIKD